MSPSGTGEGGDRGNSPETDATVQPSGLKLADYASHKQIPVGFLESLDLQEMTYNRVPAIRIPYKDGNGEEVSVRYRLALNGDNRFKWRSGSHTLLYGLERLNHDDNQVIVVEGESDAQTLWFHSYNAVGIPGANTWNDDRDAEHLAGFETVFVLVEPDRGGETVTETFTESSLRDRVKLVELGEWKDVSELHRAGPDRFRERFDGALEHAELLTDILDRERIRAREEAFKNAESIITYPRILDLFGVDVFQAGVVGEELITKLLFLAMNTRWQPVPTSVLVKGVSSGGKSFLVKMVLGFFPDDAFLDLTAFSERALIYMDRSVKNKFLVLYEAEGLADGLIAYLVRSLQSEGKLRYMTVVKDTKGNMTERFIEKEGPTGLILTTTRAVLHAENETRSMSVVVSDTTEHTRRVLEMIADDELDLVDYDKWQAFARWLDLSDHKVQIPYALKLARSIPPIATRLRRDFQALLNLITAHALIHQYHRERDSKGRIVATVDDYAEVRSLVAEVIAAGVEATVSQTTREAVEAVAKLEREGQLGITYAMVARELNLDKSSGQRRVLTAEAAGYIKNLEEKRGRPAVLKLGDPLPEDMIILPDPKDLEP